MSFWKNTDNYIKSKSISRKQLSIATGIKVDTIDRAIQRNSEPNISDGLKICAFLKVTPNTLLDEPVPLSPDSLNDAEIHKEAKLFRKYHDLILNCEKLSESQVNAITQLSKNLTE